MATVSKRRKNGKEVYVVDYRDGGGRVARCLGLSRRLGGGVPVAGHPYLPVSAAVVVRSARTGVTP